MLEPTVFHTQDPIGRLDETVIMRDDDDRRFAVRAELSQQTEDFCTRFGIEFSGGFIGENKFWLLQQCAGDRDSLLFATGKLVWSVVESISQTDLLQHGHSLTSTFGGDSLWKVRNQRVVDGVEVVQQIEALKDEADIVSPVSIPFGVAQRGEFAAFEDDLTGCRFVQSADQVQQTAFSAAGWTQDKMELAAVDRAGDTSQCVDLGLPFQVSFGDVLNVDH